MSEFCSKAIADRQFDPGYDDPAIDQEPTCDGCDAPDVRLTDYYDGRLKTPLMLCADCCQLKAERSQERSDAQFYGGARAGVETGGPRAGR